MCEVLVEVGIAVFDIFELVDYALAHYKFQKLL